MAGAVEDGEVERNLAAALCAMEHSRRPEEVPSVVHQLSEWLQAPEQRNLRRAFSVWLGRELIPGRFGGEDLLPLNDLNGPLSHPR